MSYSSALGASAPGHQITHRGRRFIVSPLTQAAKAAFERRLIEQAMAAAALVPDPWRLATLTAISKEAAGGTFSFYGRTGQEALSSESGLVMLASVLLDCTTDEAVMLASERGPELFAILDLIMLESLPEKQREQVLATRAQQKAADEAKAQATVQGGAPAVPPGPAST